MKGSIRVKLLVFGFVILAGFVGGAFYAGSKITPPVKSSELILDNKQFGF